MEAPARVAACPLVPPMAAITAWTAFSWPKLEWVLVGAWECGGGGGIPSVGDSYQDSDSESACGMHGWRKRKVGL